MHLEITPVRQPREFVLIGLGAQFFAALGLLLKQRLELLDHLVHRLHHTAQFRGARQVRQAEEFTPGDGVGLFDHVIQRLQLATQEQRAEHRTHGAAHQQPTEAAQRALPQFGHGKHRMADHLDPRGLFPAATDQCIAAGRLQTDQFDEPVRHVAHRGGTVALDDGLVGLHIDHADTRVVAAVENRADQQLNHRRVVDIRRQRQRQRGGGVLSVRAQLVDVLSTRALQTDHEAAGEGDHQEQTDSEQQLFEQGHLSACS